MSSNAYDLAGRLTLSVDQAGLETTYAYSDGGRISTVASPGGATNITERYLDGRTKSVTGNGVVPQYYDYGVNGDGSQWTKTYTGSGGTNSAMWVKTTTDMLGRMLKEERPGFGGATVTTIYAYDGAGRLTNSATTGMANTLYEYNALGEQIRTGLDISGNGVLVLAGPDRITESDTSYQSDVSDDWWRVSISAVYAEDGSGVATTTSVQKVRLTGLSANKTSELGGVGSRLNIEHYACSVLGDVVGWRHGQTSASEYP